MKLNIKYNKIYCGLFKNNLHLKNDLNNAMERCALFQMTFYLTNKNDLLKLHQNNMYKKITIIKTLMCIIIY